MSNMRRFIQCDVFSSIPGKGNALAVVVDGEGISDERMQAFAAWTNLAETTFLLPPDDPAADYRVRIFTTSREMPFAGHPTLGSCAAWLHTGGKPRDSQLIRQQCAIGIIEIHRQGQQLAFAAPDTTIEPLPPADEQAITGALKLPAKRVVRTALLNNGPVWQVLQLQSAEDVLAVESASVAWPGHQSIGLIGAHGAGHADGCDYEVRMLAPSSGMSEDPITGSLNAALAHWLKSLGELPPSLTIAQGTCIDRVGRVYISHDSNSGRILIGGNTEIMIDGSLSF